MDRLSPFFLILALVDAVVDALVVIPSRSISRYGEPILLIISSPRHWHGRGGRGDIRGIAQKRTEILTTT